MQNNVNLSHSIKVRPLGVFGAEVQGIDLADVTDMEIDAVKKAWYRHDVLLFRNQQLTDDDLLSFSRHFGTLDSPPNQGAGRKSPPGYPEVYIVSNVLDEQGAPIGALGDGEAAWHTDMSYLAQPPDASMLYSLEIPAQGGDTWFSSMKAALARMPKTLVERIRTLDIKHDGTYDSGGFLRKGLQSSNDPRGSVGTPHPVVIQPALYRHRWALGDLVLWDNRTTMHRRDAFDPKARRVMHRTQIKGSGAPGRATRLRALQRL